MKLLALAVMILSYARPALALDGQVQIHDPSTIVQCEGNYYIYGTGAAWPVIDGWVIPDDQFKLYEAGKYNDVAILVGYNSDEGLSFSREKTPEQFRANVEKRCGPFAEKLLPAYPVGTNSVPKTARTGKSKVFYYYFDQHPDRGADSPQADHGTPHGVDVSCVFQTLDPNKPGATPSDLEISEAIATCWANFAKRGDPNGVGLPTWPQFTEHKRQVMYFRNKPCPGPVPSAAALEVLESYFAWRRTPKGEAWAK